MSVSRRCTGSCPVSTGIGSPAATPTTPQRTRPGGSLPRGGRSHPCAEARPGRHSRAVRAGSPLPPASALPSLSPSTSSERCAPGSRTNGSQKDATRSRTSTRAARARDRWVVAVRHRTRASLCREVSRSRSPARRSVATSTRCAVAGRTAPARALATSASMTPARGSSTRASTMRVGRGASTSMRPKGLGSRSRATLCAWERPRVRTRGTRLGLRLASPAHRARAP